MGLPGVRNASRLRQKRGDQHMRAGQYLLKTTESDAWKDAPTRYERRRSARELPTTPSLGGWWGENVKFVELAIKYATVNFSLHVLRALRG